MRKIIRLAALAVGAAALCVTVTTSASAQEVQPPDGGSWDHTFSTSDAAHGATVYVEEHGDVIMLCDTAADGLAADVDVSWPGGKPDSWEVTGGNGSCVTRDAANGWNIPENTEVTVEVALFDNTDPWRGEFNSTTHHYLNDH